ATRLDEASHRRIEMALPIVTMSFARGGLSLRKDKIEYDMRLTDLGPGGIRADSSGATCIPGLYAAGAASDHGEDGVSNVIGHGMESCIGGWRAGKGASEFSLRGEKPGFKDQQASELIEKTFKPLNRKRGINHRELRREIGKIRDEGLLGAIRTADRIKKAITAVDAIKASLPLVTAGDYHELTRVLGLGNELLFVELLAKCSLYRTESRGSHYREDYPERNDKNWLKWVIARDDGDHIRIWDQPVTGQVIRERI
ncbi:MAG: FAD-binding protein, partial [Dehalococcoidia bacterium]|nr:FAD-binding protein [Dehalococcoidia bacterium]